MPLGATPADSCRVFIQEPKYARILASMYPSTSERTVRSLKVEIINLHGLNLNEARAKVQQNLEWAIKHGVDVLVINHGKGLHSGGIAVLKTEIRNLLKADLSLRENGYLVVYGESNLPIALTYNEGNTLIVSRGLESQHIGGQAQQAKNQRVFSEEGKQTRKAQKRWRHDR